MQRCPLYLVNSNGQDKSLTDWRREDFVVFDKLICVLSHVFNVEHVVQVTVFVRDQIKYNMAVFLKGIYVVEHYKRISIELCGHCLSSLPVDQIEICLQQTNINRSTSRI